MDPRLLAGTFKAFIAGLRKAGDSANVSEAAYSSRAPAEKSSPDLQEGKADDRSCWICRFFELYNDLKPVAESDEAGNSLCGWLRFYLRVDQQEKVLCKCYGNKKNDLGSWLTTVKKYGCRDLLHLFTFPSYMKNY